MLSRRCPPARNGEPRPTPGYLRELEPILTNVTGRFHVAAIAVGRQLKPATAGAGPGIAKPAEHCEVPFAGSPLTAESPEGNSAVLVVTLVAVKPGDAQHEFALPMLFHPLTTRPPSAIL